MFLFKVILLQKQLIFIILNDLNFFFLQFFNFQKLIIIFWFFQYPIFLLPIKSLFCDLKKSPVTIFPVYFKSSYFFKKRLMFKNQFLRNKFLFFSKIQKINKSPHSLNSFKNDFFFVKYKINLEKNWHYLIGNFIPVMSWLNTNFLTNVQTLSLKTIKKFPLNENSLNLKLENNFKQLKAIFLKNYEYLNTFFLDYKTLSYNFKTLITKLPEKSHFTETLKPYFFLNSTEPLSHFNFYSFKNYWFVYNYKTYINLMPLKKKKKNLIN